MANYKVVLKNTVDKDLLRVPKKDVASINRRIMELASEPRPMGCEKLSGQERYRIRQGDYRIIYEIRDKVLIVIVIKVGHRREVYRT